MAFCERCGAKYDPQEVEDNMWAYCRIFDDLVYGGLCFPCACDKFEEVTGIDPDTEYDEFTDEDAEDIVELMGFFGSRRKKRE